MFVVINGRFLTQKLTGVQRFACELVRALDALIGKGIIDPKYSLLLITPSGTEIPFKLSHIRVEQAGLFAGHLWEQLELPLYARRGVLLNLCNSAPLLKTQQLVVIHDAGVYAVPHAYSVVFRAWYKFMLPLLGKMARHLVTVSYFSRSELVRYCGYDEAKITVVWEGTEPV
ncbi:MAG: glycosyltransferase family 4 protein, partial [Candidatus Saccharimonadales bacterium]